MQFETYLKDRLRKPLPGFEAQKKMGPERISGELTHKVPVPDNCRKNAVMILLYPETEEKDYRLILTVRSGAMPSHAGEVSCPGGGIEPGETPEETAFRETEEEVGITRSQIELIGKLSDLYIPVTNNLIHPHVGFLSSEPNLRINPDEVKEVITPKLSDLTGTGRLKNETWTIRGQKINVPFWDIHNPPLWGATAMILSELISVIEELRGS